MLRVCPQLILFQVKKWHNKCKSRYSRLPSYEQLNTRHFNAEVSQEHLWDGERGTLKEIIHILVYLSIYSITLKMRALPHEKNPWYLYKFTLKANQTNK